jgi:hypothetical protein
LPKTADQADGVLRGRVMHFNGTACDLNTRRQERQCGWENFETRDMEAELPISTKTAEFRFRSSFGPSMISCLTLTAPPPPLAVHRW